MERGAAHRCGAGAHRIGPARGGAIADDAFVDVAAARRRAVERPADGQSGRIEVDRLVHRRAAAVVLPVVTDRDMVVVADGIDAADPFAVGDHRQASVGCDRDGRGGKIVGAKAQVAVLDCEKFGESMYIVAQLKMGRPTDEARDRFLRAVEEIPEITEGYTLFGEMDVMLKVLAPGMGWYQNFTFRTVLRLPGVEDIRSIATLSEMTCTHRLPLPSA